MEDWLDPCLDADEMRATDTWDRLEKVFEDRVQRALNKLGIPGREEIAGLSARELLTRLHALQREDRAEDGE